LLKKASAPTPNPASPEGIARKKHLRAIALAWTFGICLALVYAAIRYVPAAGWRISDVTTSATAEYPELQSRLYDSAPENTTILTAAAAAMLPQWKVLRTEPSAHRVVCEVTSSFGLTTDDVTISVEPFGPKGNLSRVQIHSRSRFGKADLGQNAQHIRDLQTAMDDKVPRIRGL
jgi:uncharacterized protein (DUF1499 family)